MYHAIWIRIDKNKKNNITFSKFISCWELQSHFQPCIYFSFNPKRSGHHPSSSRVWPNESKPESSKEKHKTESYLSVLLRMKITIYLDAAERYLKLLIRSRRAFKSRKHMLTAAELKKWLGKKKKKKNMSTSN